MTQSDTPSPEAPIIVLGRSDYYVAFPSSVEEAVALVRPRDGGGGYSAVPPVGELDFFDVSGRRLEPIIVAGKLEGLAVHDEQAEIRHRIDRYHHYLSTGAPRGEHPVTPRPFTDENLDFEETIRQLAQLNAALVAGGCSWVAWVWGHCKP